MDYPKSIQNILRKEKIQIGDTIKISCKKGEFRGILMPHHEFSNKDIITIKLSSGYNIGIEVDESIILEFLKKGDKISKNGYKEKMDDKKPTISILGTGGTIASYVDYRTGAVHPALRTDDLVRSVPELAQFGNIKAKVLFSLFSEDMRIKNWQELAKETANELNDGASGVIIPHGTDTLGYTAAALSFMLRNLTGPVILVGAQRSSDRPSTDANLNLISAASLAVNSDLGEVVVAMHSSTSDTDIAIHRGCRVRKMHSSSRDAFCCVNEEPIGFVKNSRISIKRPHRNRNKGKVEVCDNMEEKVAIFYSHPGISPDHFDHLVENNKGIVIAGTGLGHIPKNLIESVKSAVSKGIVVVMTSQCLYGRVNMNVYSSGRDLISAGVISGEDMLCETALIKLMWVLGQKQEKAEIEELFRSNIAGEIGLMRAI